MSTRISSRRLPTSPQQPTRSTRNRSHDVSDNENAPVAPAKGARPARRGRPSKQAVGARQDLAPVAEDNPEEPIQARDKRARKSSGVASALSGTTARTSLTDQDLAEMDSEEMIEKLPSLSHLSELLLDRLSPHGITIPTLQKIVRDLKEPSLRSTKNVKKEAKELREAREKFGNGPLINLSVALRGIIGVRHAAELSSGLWRPDEILYKANLAATVEDLYRRLEAEAPSLPLEKLDRDFPEPFLSRLANTGNLIPGASALFKETFELGLEIRTQFALQVLKDQSGKPNFNPEDVLNQIFYLEDETSVRGWDVDGLKGKTLKSQYRAAIAKRLQDISGKIQAISEPDSPVDFNALNEAFPLSAFLQRFMLWARSRVTELDHRINASGKPAAIQEAIEAEIRRRSAITAGDADADGDAIHLNVQHRSDTPTLDAQVMQAQQSVGLENPESIRQLKKMKQSRSKTQTVNAQQTTATPRSSLNQAPTAPMFGHPSGSVMQQGAIPLDPALFGGVVTGGDLAARSLDITSQLQAAAQAAQNVQSESHPDILRAILARNTQETAEANKENDPRASAMGPPFRPAPSLLDRQANATRAEWNTQASTQGNGDTAASGSAGQNFSEEEGFEQDQRAPPAPKRRKRARQSNGADAPVKRSKFQEIIPGSSNTPLEGPYSSSMPAEVSEYPEIQPYYEANHRAKMETAKKNLNKPPQKRRPWSVEETNLLRQCIEEIGTSWSAIKKWDSERDDVFATRDQVALKDKARNMKFDLLKAHVPLPNNFELIPLKASQKQDLLSHGVDVDAMHTAASQAA